MKPRWMRRQIACPDCGLIIKMGHGDDPVSYVEIAGQKIEVLKGETAPFDCPRCKTHFTQEDFWNEQHEKWDRTAKID